MARRKNETAAVVETALTTTIEPIAPATDEPDNGVDFRDLEDDLTSDSLEEQTAAFLANGGVIEQIPEGMTAAVHALATALKEQAVSFDATSARLFQDALDAIAQYKDEILTEFASFGPSNFQEGVLTLTETGLFVEAYRPIKYVMRQLVKDTYYRYAAVAREQQRALGRNRGVDAPDIHVAELYERGLDYPGAEHEGLTPAEQLKIVEDIYTQLDFLYVELQKFQKDFTQWEDMEIKHLPYFWHMDDDNQYHEILDVHSAFLELDRQAEARKARAIANRRAGLTALRNLRVA